MNRPYRSGALSYTVPQSHVVHMWCDIDLECRSAANDDWAVCVAVGFSFDRNATARWERFAAYMEAVMLEAGPGLFRVLRGRDEADIPSVECVALPDYRWLAWTNTREPDGLHEWTLWRAEDVTGNGTAKEGPGRPRSET